MGGAPGTWHGTTAGERAAVRRERLLRAGFELLGDGGPEGTTVRGVCERAQLNPRYFYESFADLDALIGAVFDDIVAENLRVTLAAIAAADDTAEAKTRAAMDAGIRHLACDPRRIRIVFGEGWSGVLGHRRSAMTIQTAQHMGDLAARFYGLPRDEKVLVTTTFMLAGGLFELLVAWSNGHLPLTVDELVDHATLLIVGTSRATGALVHGRRSR